MFKKIFFEDFKNEILDFRDEKNWNKTYDKENIKVWNYYVKFYLK